MEKQPNSIVKDEPTLADHAMYIYGQVMKAEDDALATDIIYCDMIKRTNHTIEDVKRLIEFRVKQNWDYSPATREELKSILTELEKLKL